MVGAVYYVEAFHLVQVKVGKEIKLSQKPWSSGKQCYLKIKLKRAKETSFYFSTDDKKYFAITSTPIDINYIAPWDRAVRVGLIAQDGNDKLAVFDDFRIENQKH
jgi:xylan 1,4-beta-xylosidase